MANWWALLGHSTFPSALSIWSPAPIGEGTYGGHQDENGEVDGRRSVLVGREEEDEEELLIIAQKKEAADHDVEAAREENLVVPRVMVTIGGGVPGAGVMDPGHESPLASSRASTSLASSPRLSASPPAAIFADGTQPPILEEGEEEPTSSSSLSPIKKAVNFSDTDRIVLIPARCDYDDETKGLLWWSLEDYEYFKQCTLEDYRVSNCLLGAFLPCD